MEGEQYHVLLFQIITRLWVSWFIICGSSSPGYQRGHGRCSWAYRREQSRVVRAGWTIVPCIFQDDETGSNVIELLNHVSWEVQERGHGLVINICGQDCNSFVIPYTQSGEAGREEDFFDSLSTAYRGVSSYPDETDYGPN